MKGWCEHDCAQWCCSSGDREVGLGWGGCWCGEAIYLLGMLGMLLSQNMLENLVIKKYLLFIDHILYYPNQDTYKIEKEAVNNYSKAGLGKS